MGQVTMNGKKIQFNLGDILKAMQVLGSILPAVKAFILSLEDHDLPGADKKSAALAFLESLLQGAGAYVGDITEPVIAVVMAFADPLIDAIVAAFNKVGVFLHKGAKGTA